MLPLPSWLSVLPMLCKALSAAVYLIMTAQRAQGMGQTCEGGEAHFDERSAAGRVEQRSAATRRHLAQEPAAPSDQFHSISLLP